MSQEHEEYEVEALGIEVDCQPIELYKVLKIANAVSGGGEAKLAIAEGYVAVNGELEQRKRRKVYDGDVIEFNEEYYLVICDKPVTEAVEKPTVKPSVSPQPKASNKAKGGAKSSAANKAKNKNTNKAAKPAKSRGGNKQGKPVSGPADKTTGRKLLSF